MLCYLLPLPHLHKKPRLGPKHHHLAAQPQMNLLWTLKLSNWLKLEILRKIPSRSMIKWLHNLFQQILLRKLNMMWKYGTIWLPILFQQVIVNISKKFYFFSDFNLSYVYSLFTAVTSPVPNAQPKESKITTSGPTSMMKKPIPHHSGGGPVKSLPAYLWRQVQANSQTPKPESSSFWPGFLDFFSGSQENKVTPRPILSMNLPPAYLDKHPTLRPGLGMILYILKIPI